MQGQAAAVCAAALWLSNISSKVYSWRASHAAHSSLDFGPHQMFFFVSDATNIDLRRLWLLADAHAKWEVERHGTAVIAWMQTRFTNARKLRGRFVVSLQHPEHEEPICHFDWRVASGQLVVTRRWSGEFSVYIARNPNLVVTSHLRLAALACGGCPIGMKPLRPGHVLRLSLNRPEFGKPTRHMDFRSAYRMNYAGTLNAVREEVYSSVEKLPDSVALLLSGGLDSSIIAAVARDIGKSIRPFVFSLKRPVIHQTRQENDLICARIVASHLGLRCTEILLDAKNLAKNVALAVFLAETQRGTIVDTCAGLIEVAKRVSGAGFSSVVMGEAADDLFGSFKFALRYMRGQGLRSYYRRELDIGLPDELAALQRIFEPWGVSVIDPFWTPKLKTIGYNVPLSYRLDSQRLMKRILRDAFARMLPDEIIQRPKVITREGTQIRYALERQFGASRERYHPMFKRMFAEGTTWPVSLQRPKSLQS